MHHKTTHHFVVNGSPVHPVMSFCVDFNNECMLIPGQRLFSDLDQNKHWLVEGDLVTEVGPQMVCTKSALTEAELVGNPALYRKLV